jgi:hypothetical protein
MNITHVKLVTIDGAKTIVYSHGDRYRAEVGIVYLKDLINDVNSFGKQYAYTSTETRMEIVAKILNDLEE